MIRNPKKKKQIQIVFTIFKQMSNTFAKPVIRFVFISSAFKNP